MSADDAVVGMVEQMLKASQENLDDSRNDFSHEAPAELSSLSLTQTSSKWGVEEGPVSARQQYTESISDMQKQVTQCNTDLIAFLCGVTKTRENFSENELSSTEAVTYLTEQILDSYDAASKVSATETGAAAFNQGITQGIVSFFSGTASVADLAQQAGVTLPSGNTTSAAAALSATPAPFDWSRRSPGWDESLVYFSGNSASASDDRAPDAFFSANDTCLADVVDA